MTVATFRCADASEERDEPLYGSASFVQRWLLVEQPGAWGPDALSQSRFPRRIALQLRRHARSAATRVVLIRRGRRLVGPGRRCYLATTTVEATRLTRFTIDAPEELLDLDLRAHAAGRSTVGAEQTDPLVLVCTHGRHDACCSIRGNQISRLICARDDVDAWECAHIGGDRFAANVVCFPHGIYYGRVTADNAGQVVDDYRKGILAIANFRGRCAVPFPVQAAEYFLRQERGLTGIDDATIVGHSARDELVIGLFETAEGRVAVEVGVDRDAESQLLTCGATAPNFIPRYELKTITRLG